MVMITDEDLVSTSHPGHQCYYSCELGKNKLFSAFEILTVMNQL